MLYRTLDSRFFEVYKLVKLPIHSMVACLKIGFSIFERKLIF